MSLFKRRLKESNERAASSEDRMDILKALQLDHIETIYANNVGAGHNYIEIRLRFAFVNSPESVRNIVEIALPPMIAKGLVKVLDEEVKLYETEIGPIYMPDDKSGLEALFGTKIEGRTDE